MHRSRVEQAMIANFSEMLDYNEAARERCVSAAPNSHPAQHNSSWMENKLDGQLISSQKYSSSEFEGNLNLLQHVSRSCVLLTVTLASTPFPLVVIPFHPDARSIPCGCPPPTKIASCPAFTMICGVYGSTVCVTTA